MDEMPTMEDERRELRRLIHIQLRVLTYETMSKADKEAMLPGLQDMIRRLEAMTLAIGSVDTVSKP